MTISVDPASTGFLRAFGVVRFLAETEAAGLVTPNLDEARTLTDRQDAGQAAEALSARYGAAAVKLGERGAILAREGRVVARAPAMDAEMIDSTGAGDAFAAGLLTALLAGHADDDTITAGCRAGAEAVIHLGGRPKISISAHFTPNELYPIDTN